MTAKQPPSHDGKVSWFRYEDLVDDWVTFTTIEASKREGHSSRAGSSETLTCTRQFSRMTFCKILKKESTIARARCTYTDFSVASKFEILLMRLKAALMDLMPIHTAQSPEFIARRMAAHQQAAGVRATLPDLLSIDNPQVLKQHLNGMQTRHKDAFALSDNRIAQFFIIQSELSDQQRERLISPMSLRKSSLENYTYKMMKTQYHDLFNNENIHPRSIHPTSRRKSE